MNDIFRRQVKPGVEEKFTGVSRQIAQNWRILEHGERASCMWLSSRIGQLHRELDRSAEFHYKVRQIGDLAAGSKPYHWIPLVEHDNCRSGLLYLPPGGRIAMHDHPHSICVSMVLDGTPLISQCDRVPGRRHAFTQLAQEEISCRRLQPHQKSFIFPQKSNMHGFSSSGSSCLLLNSVFQRKAMHHHRLLSGQLISRSLFGEHFSSALLPAMFLSMSLSLPASVYADDAFHSVDSATTVLAEMPFDTLERYALDGNVEAQTSLAGRYSSGVGVQKDLYRAGIWYRRAAEGGCTEAQYRIGVMLIDGEGITEDSNEGSEWIFRASQADHANATSVFNYLMANPVALDC